MDKGIFLDRDGVINYPVLNPERNEYEAPFNKEDFVMFPGVIETLRELIKLNYKLFLISNQPDYAKGKTTFENLLSVHNRMDSIFKENNIIFSEYYYCYHHPKGIVPKYSIVCECRKPGNLFLKQAQLKYSLDMKKSWIIGDRDTDIYCGQSLGTKSIMIKQKHFDGKAGQSKPDHTVNDLKEAVEIIKHATN